jgi:uncharacterized protein (DUF362 family)
VSEKHDDRETVCSRRVDPNGDATGVVAELLDALGGFEGRFSPGAKVLIKPNFVAPFPAATTDLAVIGAVAAAISAASGVPIVGESSGYEFSADSTHEVLGVRPYLAERGIEFVNLDEYPYEEVTLAATGQKVELTRLAIESEMVVNLPVLKGHTITKVTGATKNFFGLLSRESRRRLHVSGLHEGIGALARHFPTAVHFADARNLLIRAVFSDVKPLGFFLAAEDSFALDHFGSKLLGIEPESVIHLSAAPGVPDYVVEGALPEGLEDELSRRDAPRDKFHRALYSAFYLVDEVKSRTVGGPSLIPHLHWNLGVHPELGNLSDAELHRLADLCPVGAIDVEKRQIVADKCMPVRCMACLRAASEPDAVRLKGLNPPKKSAAANDTESSKDSE